MKIYWNTLNPRLRALSVFLVAFVAIQIVFFAVDGSIKQIDVLFGIYIGGFVTYFLARWGFFAIRLPIVLPNQEITTYEKIRKNSK